MFRRFKRRLQEERIQDADAENWQGKQDTFLPSLKVVALEGEQYQEIPLELEDLDELNPDSGQYLWIKIKGTHDKDYVDQIASRFELHPLMVEDIVEHGARPKLEMYDHRLFLVLRLLTYDEEEMRVVAEHVSIVADKSMLLTFQEREHNVWDGLEKRLIHGLGRIKTFGYDHLLFALLDAVVDEYFLAIGRLAEDIEELENKVLADRRERILTRLYKLKREVLYMHRSMWPLREAIGRLSREYMVDSPDDVRFLTANLQQDVLQVIEAVDTLREMLSEMLELYMSRKDLRMNEVGQVLTVVATIFIPLTFITGFYGMNFVNMPMIEWRYGYDTVVLAMLILAVILFLYFRTKRWFNFRDDDDER